MRGWFRECMVSGSLLLALVGGGAVRAAVPWIETPESGSMAASSRRVAFDLEIPHHLRVPSMNRAVPAEPPKLPPPRRIIPVAGVYPQVKSVFKDCETCPEMVVVGPGTYARGSPTTEKERWKDEEPVRDVRIGYSFAVGVYEVTFAEWQSCVAGWGCAGNRKPRSQSFGEGRRPVIDVSWKDAQEYVAWLRETTGQGYRLLSEAEWEYVARAGTTTPYWWGSTTTTAQANHVGSTYGEGGKLDWRAQTVEVGSLRNPNPWGLHDVHGNVYEWVEDCYADTYAKAPDDGGAYTSMSCDRAVIRGGAWSSHSRTLRSASRGGYPPGERDDSLGFRVARTIP